MSEFGEIMACLESPLVTIDWAQDNSLIMINTLGKMQLLF
jgi:hypothetical protein